MKFKFRRALSILILFVIFAGLHLFVYTQNISLKYKITDGKIKLSEVVSQNRELGSELAAKENLASVEKIASGKLDMFYPENINYILGASNPASISAEASLDNPKN